uniref:Uncharacterized protein n=1 Tax=Clandestinovirus TaxID=2831644 RepID=A0A8F8KL60_9VIRU|nr:hypothetical protein KOM_12_104 [Clandestinovirus]
MTETTQWNSVLEKEFFDCSSINGPGWNSFNSINEFTIGRMNHRIPKQWKSNDNEFRFSPEFTAHVHQTTGCKTFNIDVTYGGNTAFLGRDEIHQVGSVIDCILEAGVDIWLQHCFDVVYYAKEYPRVKYSRIQTEVKLIETIRKSIAFYSKTNLDELPVLLEQFSDEQKEAIQTANGVMPIRYFATWNWLTEEGRKFVSSYLKVGNIEDPWKDATPFWEWPKFESMRGEIETLFV